MRKKYIIMRNMCITAVYDKYAQILEFKTARDFLEIRATDCACVITSVQCV